MRSTDIFAPLFFAATALAQGPPEGIAPSTQPPSGCEPNSNGNFTIGTLKLDSKKRETAAEAANGALICNLNKGILRDRDGRTGSVVANRQFQFDGPPQAGAIYTGGFSICSNGSLAIGGSTRWWQCSSGGFYNLYDEWIGAQCEEIRIQVAMVGPQSTPSSKSAGAPSSSMASTQVASVQSSLATISGAVSTVSKSAIGPSASFTSMNSTMTGSDSMTMSMPSTTMSGSTGTRSSSPTRSPSSTADAPPAGGAAPSSFGVAKGSMLGAFVVIFGAALVL